MNKQAVQTAFPLWEAVCRHIGDAPYRIVYEDEAVLVCCKRAGVPVQSASLRTPDLESMLRGYLKGAYLGIVHRLDQPVAGLLVAAKTKQAAASLSKQVQDGTMCKEYLAVVRGTPDAKQPLRQAADGAGNKSGTLVDYLIKVQEGKSASARVVSPQTAGARRAALDYEILASDGVYALLRVTLHTGRFHQIRVQLAHAGCPIVGDLKYGAETALDAPLMLCAYRLAFTHPVTKKRQRFSLEDEESNE